MPQEPVAVTDPSPIAVNRLRRDRSVSFRLAPGAGERAALAAEFGLVKLRKLRFEGLIRAEGASDWRLTGRLGATVVQACVVSGDPVSSRVEENVTRLYTPDAPEPPGRADAEVEIPDDVDVEPLGRFIEPASVMAEALSLALPPFPRKEGAALGEAVFSAPGVAAMTDADARPFAALRSLAAGSGGGE